MLPDYRDITSRLGEPLWFDRHGVPRYDPFRPGMCGVYATHVAFMELECQACGKRFRVAFDVDGIEMRVWLKREAQLPNTGDEGDFFYGDPPWHDLEGGSVCPGVTMSSTTRRILEFWVRDASTGHEWARKPEYEVEFDWRGEQHEPELG